MITFTDYLEVERGLSARSIKAYLDAIPADLLKKETITKEDIYDFVKFCNRKKYQNATTRLYLSAIKQYCIFRDFASAAICIERITLKKQEKKEVVCLLNEADILKLRGFLKQENKLRNRLLVDLLAGTGGRVSEVLALTLNDFGEDEASIKTVTLHQTKNPVPRTVILTQAAEESLIAYIKAEEITDKGAKLFAGLTRHGAAKILKRALVKIGLPEQSPHKLRHFFATYYGNIIKTQQQFQKLMGHASPASSAIYFDKADLREYTGAMREFCSGKQAANFDASRLTAQAAV